MLSRKALAIASLSTIVCSQAVLTAVVSNPAMAEDTFKTSDFLNLPPENQRGYVTTAAMAAGLIAAGNRKEQAKCIDDWGAEHRKDGYKPVIDAMKRLPDYHPMAIIIAVFEKACGEFKYAAKSAALP
ncbi:MAG: hypothetical protein WC807_15460 [Hyphomicrobium sp.]|jgi:hypothetical protein|uniref:hypothetical protein n=1 Tax=Hyphomicrobium sp. DMF-1 TaxID=3019544 RepID=UPI0022EBA6B9|nr:hypothetical protein [Hyphomicrobium sp. DMF-1]WBT37909.1 hypothetical protein PE058_19970 [Hyphomicrobium sp. DMF-1]